MNVNDSEIKLILQKYKALTVYGMSPDAFKPSHQIPVYMHNHGYEVVGTYPQGDEFAGIKIYRNLSGVPAENRKFVDVFRRSERVPEVVDEVLEVRGVEVLWLQLGISHSEAEKRAEAAGLKVISNRCLLVEHRRHFR